MPIVPRLVRAFGDGNIAKLVHVGMVHIVSSDEIHDFKDGKEYRSWFDADNIFADGNSILACPLGHFMDGVNCNRNNAIQRS